MENEKESLDHLLPSDPNDKPNYMKEAYLFFKSILDIREGTEKIATSENIKNNISIKGILSWILVFSILIASIGLYTSSGAVVIGAMLISPLMGPIVGLGYSIAVNDVATLRKAINNFVIMVIISIVTAFLFFKISPDLEFTIELKSRTSPTFYDVLIAIFGGFTGIIAATRNEVSNVIPGVAIATALMPPLCTAGYGLAMGGTNLGDTTGWNVFFNAFYLFLINSFFIALTTFLVLKVLKFPMVTSQDKKTKKRNSWIIGATSILMIIPSIFIFTKTLNQTRFNNNVKKFVENINHGDYLLEVAKTSIINNQKTIELRSNRAIPQATEAKWQDLLTEYNIQETILIIHDGEDFSNILEKSRANSTQYLFSRLETKDSTILSLKNQIKNLQADSIPFNSIARELKVQYPEVSNFGYGVLNQTDFKNKDNIPTFTLKWNSKDSLSNKVLIKDKVAKWLKVRLNVNKLRVIETE